jgi:F-type H+-transporting ATPase subunit b
VAGLGLDLPTFISQLISFLVLLALLTFFGYKPIRAMLDQRSRKIKESMEREEAIKKEYEQSHITVQEEIRKAHEQGQNIVIRAAQAGKKIEEEAQQKAREKAQVAIERARVEAQRERARAIEELRREFVDTSILAAEKVIRETLDKEKHRSLIEETLKESVIFKEN